MAAGGVRGKGTLGLQVSSLIGFRSILISGEDMLSNWIGQLTSHPALPLFLSLSGQDVEHSRRFGQLRVDHMISQRYRYKGSWNSFQIESRHHLSSDLTHALQVHVSFACSL
jgi:hypothetical protein